MGTRHLIAVAKDGEYKVAQYGQWDGYPSGQGIDILDFLSNKMKRPLFDERVTATFFIDEESDLELSPSLNRNTGAEILDIVQDSTQPVGLDNNIEFVADSLFCEWAYVIDLDKNAFEIYEGFVREPLAESERFFNFYNGDPEYYPVKLLRSYALSDLPTSEAFLQETEGVEA